MDAAARAAAANVRARARRHRRRRPARLRTRQAGCPRARACRARARDRRGLSRAELRTGTGGRRARLDRCEDAHVPGLRVRRRRIPVDPRHENERPGDDLGCPSRLVRASQRTRRDPRRATGRLAERAVLPTRQRVRWTRRVRTVHREAAHTRQSPRRCRARDADMAGLQLRRRERRRLGRLLVCERCDAIRRPDAALPRLRRFRSTSTTGISRSSPGSRRTGSRSTS